MRYVAIAVDYSFGGEPALTADTIHEGGDGPVPTGLLNADGVPLYRVPERVPLGFHAKPRVRVKAGSR
jgi:hypothetical protein